MPVDPKDRAAYEEGREDSQRGIVETIIRNAVETVTAVAVPVQHERSESEQAAYDKGLSGQQLDED